MSASGEIPVNRELNEAIDMLVSMPRKDMNPEERELALKTLIDVHGVEDVKVSLLTMWQRTPTIDSHSDAYNNLSDVLQTFHDKQSDHWDHEMNMLPGYYDIQLKHQQPATRYPSYERAKRRDTVAGLKLAERIEAERLARTGQGSPGKGSTTSTSTDETASTDPRFKPS